MFVFSLIELASLTQEPASVFWPWIAVKVAPPAALIESSGIIRVF